MILLSLFPIAFGGVIYFFFSHFLCRVSAESLVRGFYQKWGIFNN